MKKYRFLLALALCVSLLAGAVCPAAAAETGARLYNVYGDHMLFQQNADAVFAGEAAPGAVLTAALTDESGAVVRTASGAAGADGTFSLSFPAPAGSFDPYTVTITANGATAATLSDVVFGELWLSFGQSNMEYNLHGTPEGREMQAAGKTGSRHLRVLQVPHPIKDGKIYSEALPQTDAQNCYWYTGDQKDVYNMSACGYFFAEKLIGELNVPVGILNTAVGGSALEAWIPRASFEAAPDIQNELAERGHYIPLASWDSGNRQYHVDMTGLYNSRIAPLTNFRPTGGIWYQGETDLMLYNDPAFYGRLFSLMQDSYTDLFAHTDGKMPMIFTQLVTFCYGGGPYYETRFNEAFTALAAADPASRGEVVVSDLTPAYYDEWGSIHPMTKKPIAERMAVCAGGLVYGSGAPASAPAKTGAEVRDGSVYVTFSNAGDGLTSAGDALHGFAVYGADGVCLPAQAEIVSADTVRVFSDDVPAPAGATYAVNSLSPDANLWSSFGGAPCLPAAAFGASDPAVKKQFDDASWLRCDTLTAWQNHAGAAGVKDVWTAKRAALSVTGDAAEGEGALRVAADKRSFSVSAPFAEDRNGKPVIFDSLDTDFTAYGTLSLQVKNTGKKNVTLSQLRLYKGTKIYFCPENLASGRNGVVIPADGAWHTLTFDLNALGLYGAEADRWNNDVLGDVTELRLCFYGADAALQLDGFRFSPEPAKPYAGGRLQQFIARLIALYERIAAAFTEALPKC